MTQSNRQSADPDAGAPSTRGPDLPVGEDTSAAEPPPRVGSPLWVHAGLFLATVITTTGAGAVYAQGQIMPIRNGLSFSIPLMAILLCHEFGHYLMARKHGVPASLPYFIPVPPTVFLLGTMGAVIRMGDASYDRRKLFDIGAAGPLAGLAVAIPVLIYGIHLSEVTVIQGVAYQEGNSLLYAAIKYLVKGQWLPGQGVDVDLHPTALAGWAGLLVTMLNLLPFGQLDGGHIAVARFGDRYIQLSPRLHKILLGLGSLVFFFVLQEARSALETSALAREAAAGGLTPFSLAASAGMFWVVWFGMIRLMRRMGRGVEHPPVDGRGLGVGRRAVFWLVAVVFLSIFMPAPFRMKTGSADGMGEAVPKSRVESHSI